MNTIPSYPKIFNLGHPQIKDLFSGPVTIQEKVDGSQFSFMRDATGQIHCRSKSAVVNIAAPGMFAAAVDTVLQVADRLIPGVVYRGEYLSKPKHNTLVYERVPRGNIILFDVVSLHEIYMNLRDEAKRLDLECVPEIGTFDSVTLEELDAILTRQSILGGVKIEGVVIKNYGKFGEDGKALMGKHVSPAFKEKHSKDWKERNPSQTAVVENIGALFCTPARWEKAVQRLRDLGGLTNDPRDIGVLLPMVKEDVLTECEVEIKEALWTWAKTKVARGAAHGFAEWYKARLTDQQFANSIVAEWLEGGTPCA
jgi:hypothetical protein